MSSNSNSVITKLVDRVFPRMPDFYHLLNDQCEILEEGILAFVQYMEHCCEENAVTVRQVEKIGDEVKKRNTDILNRAFATPMDREDIYRAIVSLDKILNYAKTTTREMEALELTADGYMLEIVKEYLVGVRALKAGYGKLGKNPSLAEDDARVARKTERIIEKIYRRALADLFKVDDLVKQLNDDAPGAKAEAMMAVVEMFKRRELYRHLSNGADRLAHAADVLHDIVVKIS
jgi:uncharacterized protein Yka (UPF0111/DUF47 family)